MDVVREEALSVQLDDRKPFAVLGLELGVAGDVDLDELERVLGAHLLQDRARPVAEVAARCAEEDDARRYGYRPRVVVASATRCTARPYAAIRIDASLCSCTFHVSLNARVVMSLRRAFTSVSFQKYSCRP
jgi:hypothetical protein